MILFLGTVKKITGETGHRACAVAKDGTRIWNKTLPNDDAKLVTV